MPIPPPQFGVVNYAALVIYFAAMLGVGWWAGRRVKSSSGYFVAEGKMGAVLVGLSLLGTYLSAMTMMGLPGKSFGPDDLTYTIQLPFLLLTAYVITRFVLPRYRAAGVLSVYEYLERRIDISAALALQGFLLAFLATVVASILPAWKASRMNIVDALRHHA
ncbi:MAG: hypothetical protein HUU35_18630 [Armatimonadetes bacterium]|nr:hypothetical protein [Armatimonadota bacterium]